MPGRKRARESQAAAEERAMKRIDRAVKRYGTSAVAKYYSSPSVFKPESKYFDCTFDYTPSVSDDWTNDHVTMTNYVQSDGSTVGVYSDAAIVPSAIGNGYGQIVGNKCSIKKVKVRGTVLVDASASATGAGDSTMVRILLVHDMQANGAQFNTAGMFTDWGASSACLNSYQSIAAGSGGRIRILADKWISLSPQIVGTTTQVWEKKQFSITKTWKKGLKTVVKSGSSTPTVASLSDNNIFLVAHAFGTVQPRIIGCTRCVYMD